LVEQSFINWALHFLLWNLYTLQGTGKEKFQQALQKAYFRKLKIHKYPELFFYNIAEYHEFLRIARADSFWYKCEINCWKAMHYYKNQGFLAVIKKILKKIL